DLQCDGQEYFPRSLHGSSVSFVIVKFRVTTMLINRRWIFHLKGSSISMIDFEVFGTYAFEGREMIGRLHQQFQLDAILR
ncbi:MAG: hypothetical protein ABF292_08290, partial [Desulfobacterales bacterium]